MSLFGVPDSLVHKSPDVSFLLVVSRYLQSREGRIRGVPFLSLVMKTYDVVEKAMMIRLKY